MSSIKIFISYKDRHPLLESEILTPIQTGRAIADEVFDEMIGDNTGENISDKNENYNELTAQYWAWKHYEEIGNPDYVGFMHYRRHFIFNEKEYSPNFLGVVNYSDINEDYKNEISLKDDEIEKFVIDSDMVCIRRLDLNKRAELLKAEQCSNPRGCYYYNRGLKVEDYDLMIETLKELKPEYAQSAEKYTKGNISFGYNSFIMKKELFFEYNEFLFAILFELEKKIDFSNYCKQGIRSLGYLGERILSIFILHKMMENKIKIKETPMSFIQNSSIPDALPVPIWSPNCLCITSSDYYAPWTYVAIKSIIDNWKKDEPLDIVILSKDFSQENKNIFNNDFVNEKVSIRYFDMKFFKLPQQAKKTKNITESTYYRMCIPNIFENYDKVLFLDADVVVLADLSNLFELNLEKAKMALTIDSVMQCFCTDNIHNDYDYLKNDLELEDPYKYYNCGVMLLNIKAFDADDVDNVTALLEEREYTYFDQDPINKYFKNYIKELSIEYNFNPVTMKNEIYKYMPHRYINTFEEAKTKLKIVHFNSNYKPWFYPSEPFAGKWWKYARKTPYYEEILARMIDFRSLKGKKNISDTNSLRKEFENIHFPNINNGFGNIEYRLKLLYVMNHIPLYMLQKLSYKIKKIFYFGEKYEKYNKKYNDIRRIIKDAKNLRKEMHNI